MLCRAGVRRQTPGPVRYRWVTPSSLPGVADYGAGMRRLTVIVLVLLVLAIATDVVARMVAERVLTREIAASAQLVNDPEVDIHGVPFLTQVIGGRYREVTIAASGVPTDGGIVVDKVDARLDGVRFPLSAVFGSAPATVPVDKITASATVDYTTLGDAAAERLGEGVTVQLSQRDENTLQATVSLDIAGQTVSGHAVAEVSAKDGTLVLAFPGSGLDDLPEPVRSRFPGLRSLAMPVPLPMNLTLVGATVGITGVTVTAEATDVQLTR